MEKTEFVFKNALYGYNRDDVNQYILEMSKRFKEAQDASKEKIEALTAKLASVDAPAEVGSSSEEIAALKETIDRLEQENNDLRTELDRAKNTESKHDSEPFDNLSQQIGSILVSANTTASTILTNATNDAEKMRADAESEVQKVKTKLESESDLILSKFSAELKDVLEQCLGELNATVNEIQSSAATIAADIQRKNRDMNEHVEQYRIIMSDSLAAKLDELEKSFNVVRKASLADKK